MGFRERLKKKKKRDMGPKKPLVTKVQQSPVVDVSKIEAEVSKAKLDLEILKESKKKGRLPPPHVSRCRVQFPLSSFGPSSTNSSFPNGTGTVGDDEFVVKKKALLVAMEKARNVIRKAEKKALAASGISADSKASTGEGSAPPSKEKAGSAAAPKAAKKTSTEPMDTPEPQNFSVGDAGAASKPKRSKVPAAEVEAIEAAQVTKAKTSKPTPKAPAKSTASEASPSTETNPATVKPAAAKPTTAKPSAPKPLASKPPAAATPGLADAPAPTTATAPEPAPSPTAKKQPLSSLSLHVSQLPFDCSKDKLAAHFEAHGCRLSACTKGMGAVRLCMQKDGGFSGVAFVDVADLKSVKLGLKLHRSRFGGRLVNVRPTRSPEELAAIVAKRNEALEAQGLGFKVRRPTPVAATRGARER